jgi:hypothetical protein
MIGVQWVRDRLRWKTWEVRCWKVAAGSLERRQVRAYKFAVEAIRSRTSADVVRQADSWAQRTEWCDRVEYSRCGYPGRSSAEEDG